MLLRDPSGRPRRGHALVIGGSLLGLLTAQQLVDHVDQVTVLERDRYPDGPALRPGVPQARHPHLLLVRGRAIFERAFPGLAEELARYGALAFDYAGDSILQVGGRTLPRFRSGLRTFSCSRALLEWLVHDRVANHPRICLRPETEVVELVATPDGAAVCGVRLRSRQRGIDPAQLELLNADWVIDASGRHSHAPDWVRALGYGPVSETVVDPRIGYATRCYKLPEACRTPWVAVGIATQAPDRPYGAAMLRVEQGQVIVTLVGAGGHYPGTSEAAFLDFARRVPDPLILHTLQHATPCGPIYGYRGTENRRRHFERMDRWPNRLIVLGDAACALNPIYAQGLTVGALAVSELSRWLGVQVARLQDGGEPAHSRQLQAQLARLVRLPWTLATAEDLRWPTTTGGSPSRFSPLTARYMQRLFQVMAQHAGVARSFLEVMHMVRGPSALLSPRVVLRMLASR